MCVIIVKPRDVEIPKDEYLKRCYDKNNHGSGVALLLPESDKISIKKDFDTYEQYLEYVKAIPKEAIAILHNRIRSRGDNVKENRHPFPVSNSEEDLKALEITSKWALAHNGTFFNLTSEKTGLSDTQLFVRDIISFITEDITNEGIMHLLEAYIGAKNRVVILSHTGELYKFGNFIENEGIFYSNESFKETKAISTSINYNYKKDYYGKSYMYDNKPYTYPARSVKKECPVCGGIVEHVFYFKFLDCSICTDCLVTLKKAL